MSSGRIVGSRERILTRIPPCPANLYAHTPPKGATAWDCLDRHLSAVADLVRQFASSFGEGELGHLLGFWHDLGKCNPGFQMYLTQSYLAKLGLGPKPVVRHPHSIWGASLVYRLENYFGFWAELAMPILGHHSQLKDRGEASTLLDEFISNQPGALVEMQSTLRSMGYTIARPDTRQRSDTERELLTRMLFSALVDADRLVTEVHADPASSKVRQTWPEISELIIRFTAKERLFSYADSPINRLRQEIYQRCVMSATLEPGLFRLTVPTGSGKTRSGLAFALKHIDQHAEKHGLRRIVVALPYTSIIDQTVDDYRKILGGDAVLEHHSAIDPADLPKDDERMTRQQFAEENWEAPLIVTTTVQLFESLFANRASRTRKIHRLAKSVIILDEFQTFPPELLEPTIDVLRLLALSLDRGGYGCSIVFCTATQPSFEVEALDRLLNDAAIREIVPDYADYFAHPRMRRVHFQRLPGKVNWEQVTNEIRRWNQALVVVNRRRDALAILDNIPSDDERSEHTFHLSTLLCGAHRRKVLEEIRTRLDNTNRPPVLLISTQVIEAGVELDFPHAYRAIGPWDRMIQLAGRCNRHGNYSIGEVVIFDPVDDGSPGGPYLIGTEKSRLLLEKYPICALHDPEIAREYFRLLYSEVSLDKCQTCVEGEKKLRVQDLRRAMSFPDVAACYRLIPEQTVPVVVDFEDGLQRLGAWIQSPSQQNWRRLQPYMVSIYEHERRRHLNSLIDVGNGVYQWEHGGYDARRGLAAVFDDPNDMLYSAVV